MEQRISDYIIQKIGEKGNIPAYYVLINIAYEMILNNSSEESIKARIDNLLTDPVKNQCKN